MTYKDRESALKALERDGASIMGQKVCIRLMTGTDSLESSQRRLTRGDDAAALENEKIAYSILQCSPTEQKTRLHDYLVQLTPQQKDAFLVAYRKCEHICTIRKRFDEAIEEADDPHYKEYSRVVCSM